MFSRNGKFISKFGSKGSGDGQFNNLCGLAVNDKDQIAVVDYENNRIQVFDLYGNFLFKFPVKDAMGMCKKNLNLEFSFFLIDLVFFFQYKRSLFQQ